MVAVPHPKEQHFYNPLETLKASNPTESTKLKAQVEAKFDVARLDLNYIHLLLKIYFSLLFYDTVRNHDIRKFFELME